MTSAQARKIFLIVIAAIAVLVVAVGILYRPQSLPNETEITRQTIEQQPYLLSDTWDAVPAGTTVPEPTSDVPEGVARPKTTSPLNGGSPNRFRRFSIEIKRDTFVPYTVIVHQGDIVHIDMTAVDKEYDFFQPDLGLRQTFKKGETKPIEFNPFTEGAFTFFCARCGGPEDGPVGFLIVAPLP